MQALVIANPQARRGRTGRRWPAIEKRLREALGRFELAFTEAPGDGIRLGRAGIAAGHRHIVAVGGDGTLNEVVNGMAAAGPVDRETWLSPVPAGTGNELCRALGFLQDPEAAFHAMDGQRTQHIDLLRMRCAPLAGDGAVERLAFACGSFGAAAEISYRTSASRFLKKLGGRFSYYVETLIVTLTYGKHEVTVKIDDGPPVRRVVYTGLCCNTEHAGGGMRLAPGASRSDGRFDLVTFGDIRRRDILLQKPSWLYEGRHVEHPAVTLEHGRRLTIEGSGELLVDADGETIGRLPLSIEVMPRALGIYA